MDKALEERLREAIKRAEHCEFCDCYRDDPHTTVDIAPKDAKRLLYRMIKENSKPIELEYRKKEKKS